MHRNDEDYTELYSALLRIKDEEQCRAFCSDLFTKQEMAAFTQRIRVAKLLMSGATYDMIRGQVPVSSATITRINTELQYGAGGYASVLGEDQTSGK